ncbi:transposase [Ligilactobacillus agilis]|uniref:transposase n=1 Tax=Ligilactobacillus agilis TaxID=1601 RepID=UPI003D9A57F9
MSYLTTDKNLTHVLNTANLEFTKYSNSPIEGIDRKIKLLRRLSFSMPNFTNMKKRIILWLNFKPKKKNPKKIALIS